MSQTRIFVSSTCFDLTHIRQTLSDRITEMGHIPVMSELSTFRVDPQLSNIANCRANVEKNADLFILIVGRRRGSLERASGKSIVNLEYEAATLSGLDILVFVDEAVLNILPIWEEDNDAKLTSIVDSNEVLAFVAKIRAEQRWTYTYKGEADIHEVLRKQISGQLRDLLELRRRGSLSSLARFRGEPKEAVAVLRAKHLFWQVELTAVLLEARLLKAQQELQDVLAGRVLGAHRILSGHEYLDWIQAKMYEMSAMVQRAEHLLCQNLNRACSGDEAEEILMAVEELGIIFTSACNIESDMFRTHGPDSADALRDVCLGMTGEILSAFEASNRQLRAAVETARMHNPDDGDLTLSINTKFTFSRGELFSSALAEYRRQELF